MNFFLLIFSFLNHLFFGMCTPGRFDVNVATRLCIERTVCIKKKCRVHVMRRLCVSKKVLCACNEKTVCINIKCCVHVMRGLCVSK